MLEKMSDFFENRIAGYDEHMLNDIESANEFYPFTAQLLPKGNCNIIDLGCGTGLELEFYLKLNPKAFITGIDLSGKMLDTLRAKFPDIKMNLICGSYFDVPFDENFFDGAVSVESLHHFTKQEKIPLYTKLYKALKNDACFILTDYFASCIEEEILYRQNYIKLRCEQGIDDNEYYHYDTPLTIENEKEALFKAGFSKVEVVKNWGATYTIKAIK